MNIDNMKRIFAVNSLINQVVSNTIREQNGQKGDLAEERRKTKALLNLLLQRNPSKQELDLATAESWPKDFDCVVN